RHFRPSCLVVDPRRPPSIIPLGQAVISTPAKASPSPPEAQPAGFALIDQAQPCLGLVTKWTRASGSGRTVTIERETLASVVALTLRNDNHIHDWRVPHLAHERGLGSAGPAPPETVRFG